MSQQDPVPFDASDNSDHADRLEISDPRSPRSSPSSPTTSSSLLAAYGWDDRVAALAADAATELTGLPARVIAVHRDRVAIATADGLSTASLPPAAGPPDPGTADDGLSGVPAVGDWVMVRPTPGHTIAFAVLGVLPRRSALQRVDPASSGRRMDRAQILAANVDVAFLVHPLDRPVSLARIEREQLAVWDAGARPTVVLAKADIAGVDEVDRVRADVERRLPGADVVVTSSLQGLGLAELARRARPAEFAGELTVLFIGPSGAGKTSLVNALLGEAVGEAVGEPAVPFVADAVGEVRTQDGRGRHTTTARHLRPLPGGGVLLDTPGLRSVGLWSAGGDEALAETFPDVDALAGTCRFSDCRHSGEPGCAVQAALEAGTLDAGRLASWRKLGRELAAAERRQDPRLRADHERSLRKIHREARLAVAAPVGPTAEAPIDLIGP